ncbi:MAG: helix-turn-helix transcriptional regulator [Flavobacteriales bacterium]|nr:MAG: helix-turn-helix transcriptional regulator [Flavobacteriales bacterium]
MSTAALEKNVEALNDRFIRAMEGLGYTGYSLSKELGTSEAVISNIRNRKNPPNILLVRDLLDRHLDLNPDWLLFGRGEMMRTQPLPRKGQPVPDEMLTKVYDRLTSLEDLFKRSLHAQLERSTIEEESVSALAERVKSLEREVAAVKKTASTKR